MICSIRMCEVLQTSASRACTAAQHKRLLTATADVWRWRRLLAPPFAAWRACAAIHVQRVVAVVVRCCPQEGIAAYLP